MKRQTRSGDLEDAIARTNDRRIAAIAGLVFLIGAIAIATWATVALAGAVRTERGEWGFMLDTAADELHRRRRRFRADPQGEVTEEQGDDGETTR